MPKVHIKNREQTVEVDPAYNLLNNYLMQSIPIQTVCGGKAICGRCRYQLLQGAQGLNPIRPAEVARLGEPLIAQGWRLSCQSHTLRDIVIHLPELDEEFDE